MHTRKPSLQRLIRDKFWIAAACSGEEAPLAANQSAMSACLRTLLLLILRLPAPRLKWGDGRWDAEDGFGHREVGPYWTNEIKYNEMKYFAVRFPTS